MKRLTYFLLLCTIVFSACQKDETNSELASILAKEEFDENVKQLADAHGLEIVNIMADTRAPVCNGPDFNNVLRDFVAANQEKANRLCEVVRGPISGCLEGFMTYGTGLVFPQLNQCPDFIVPEIPTHH